MGSHKNYTAQTVKLRKSQRKRIGGFNYNTKYADLTEAVKHKYIIKRNGRKIVRIKFTYRKKKK